LYTDGLVEHRGSDLDLGIDQLAAALDRAGPHLAVEALPGALVDAVVAARPDDDVAVLVAEPRAAGELRLVLPIPLQPIAVADIRHRAREVLAAGELDEDVAADALLIISELVTNAVRYGRAPAHFALRLTPRDVVIEVSDAEHRQPAVREFDPGGANGRGLHMVESLGARWGVRPTGLGKSVWCIVPREPA
jgi:anti-sigma regulatory factor (Ser/Thr protein kinase)